MVNCKWVYIGGGKENTRYFGEKIMAKNPSIPFRIVTGNDIKINTGGRIKTDGGVLTITSIKSIDLKAGRLEIIGLGKPTARAAE